MGGQKRFTNAAERQRAYRSRVLQKQIQSCTSTSKKTVKTASRPTRIAAVETQVQLLHGEYENWLESLPESLQHGEQAERLRETIEQLAVILDLMTELNPPRGFGRD